MNRSRILLLTQPFVRNYLSFWKTFAMKNLILPFLLAAATACLPGCDKNNNAGCGNGYDTGRVIGFDASLCPCCGGWFIEINGDTLRPYTLPDNFDAVLNHSTLPVEVCLKWTYNPGKPCKPNLIEVKEIMLKD